MTMTVDGNNFLIANPTGAGFSGSLKSNVVNGEVAVAMLNKQQEFSNAVKTNSPIPLPGKGLIVKLEA